MGALGSTPLIEKIDDVGLERLERSFGDFLDVLWLTVAPSGISLRLGINFPTELGSDHDLPMDGRKGLPTRSSFVNGPYASAVSKNMTPRSTAAWSGKSRAACPRWTVIKL
jgi:hypothetical protein